MNTNEHASPTKEANSFGLLQRKCACGNSASVNTECSECKKKSLLGQGVQAKVAIGGANDHYEREADSIANQVMSSNGVGSISRQASSIQRKGGDASLGQAPAIVNEVVGGSGSTIDTSTRSFMESRFGYDFSQVKIHSGHKANQSCEAINARAYTLGNHIVMANGQYQPASNEGRRLLAHELTHTIQQANGAGNYLQRETWNDDESNCTSKVTYLTQLLFDDSGSDTWTTARKNTFRSDFKRVIETTFNANTYRIKPLTRSVGSDACPCHDQGFSPKVEIDFVPDGETSVSEDWEVDVAANSSSTPITSSQNTTLGYGDFDEADNTPVSKVGAPAGVQQIPTVHEFGHFLGLQHPGEGLEGGLFSDSELSAGADEYTHVGEDEHGRTVDGTRDLMGVGMGLRPFYFNTWLRHISGKYNRFCAYRIV